MFFQTLVFLNSVLVKKFDENILMLTFLAKNFLMANMFVAIFLDGISISQPNTLEGEGSFSHSSQVPYSPSSPTHLM